LSEICSLQWIVDYGGYAVIYVISNFVKHLSPVIKTIIFDGDDDDDNDDDNDDDDDDG